MDERSLGQTHFMLIGETTHRQLKHNGATGKKLSCDKTSTFWRDLFSVMAKRSWCRPRGWALTFTSHLQFLPSYFSASHQKEYVPDSICVVHLTLKEMSTDSTLTQRHVLKNSHISALYDLSFLFSFLLGQYDNIQDDKRHGLRL